MPQIGPLEILVIGVVALLVFGPEKLPEMARSIGKGINKMKRMASDVKSEFDVSLADDDRAPSVQDVDSVRGSEPPPPVVADGGKDVPEVVASR